MKKYHFMVEMNNDTNWNLYLKIKAKTLAEATEICRKESEKKHPIFRMRLDWTNDKNCIDTF